MKRNNNGTPERRPDVSEVLYAPVHPELKRLIGDEAEGRNMTLNELVAEILARHLNRPDLAAIPRKRMGRPRKVVPV